MKKLLIVFIKNAELGKVKTRLAATIGDAQALKVYRLLLAHTFSVAKNLECDRIVYYSDFIPPSDDWQSVGFFQALQSGSDLGEKMRKAFSQGFSKHYESIVVIGSDCYELRVKHLAEAFAALDKFPFVIGPAYDGGYYLLGMTRLHEPLFKNKHWSSTTVLSDTINDIKASELPFYLLQTLHDIDNETDLIKSGIDLS